MNNKLVINLDATALGSSACILNLYNVVVGTLDESGKSEGGYREKIQGASLVYGIAIHKFLDVAFKTKGNLLKARKEAQESFNVPKKDDPKKPYLSNPTHLDSTCYNVWTDYILEESTFDLIELNLPCWLCRGTGIVSDQPCGNCKSEKLLMSAASEVTFSIKYYEDDTIIVNLCGTIDSIGKFKNGCYAIRDWKSTSSWDNAGYFQQYELSRQLRIYMLALKLMGVHYPESVLGKIGNLQVGAFIDAIFLDKEPNKVKCQRSDVFQIKPVDLDAFQLTLDTKILQLSQAIKTGYLPKEGILNGACIKPYGKCMFWDCCRNPDQVANALYQRNFSRWKFNPLQYNEI